MKIKYGCNDVNKIFFYYNESCVSATQDFFFFMTILCLLGCTVFIYSPIYYDLLQHNGSSQTLFTKSGAPFVNQNKSTKNK